MSLPPTLGVPAAIGSFTDMTTLRACHVVLCRARLLTLTQHYSSPILLTMFVPNISEAAAVRLIETILFGQHVRPPAPVPAYKRCPRRSPRAPAPTTPFALTKPHF